MKIPTQTILQQISLICFVKENQLLYDHVWELSSLVTWEHN